MAFYCMRKDDFLAIVVPILVYWAYSCLYLMLGSLDKYRLHSRNDEDALNLVSKRKVVIVVLRQQLIQATTGFMLFKFTSRDNVVKSNPSLMTSCYQFLIGILVVDTWQFFVHRYMHINKFLYKHVHSWHRDEFFCPRFVCARCPQPITAPDIRLLQLNPLIVWGFKCKKAKMGRFDWWAHRGQGWWAQKNCSPWHHRLVVPYPFGAQYIHPLEGFVLEIMGSVVAFWLSGMSARTSISFFSLYTMKGVDDHCGLWLPWHPFHVFLSNNTAYHDVHHQIYGTKYNFSQTFFVHWDKMLGTYMPYTLEKRDGGGFETKPVKKQT